MKRLLRIHDIIGDKRRGIPALVPMSRAGWYAGIAKGIYPPPVKLAEGTRASYWHEDDILALIQRSRGA